MKFQATLSIAALTALCLSAHAQDRIVGPSPSSRTTWELFAEPGASNPARQIPVAELPAPIAILESKASYHRIDLQGQPLWIKGAHARIGRDSKAGCTTTKLAPTTQTIATPGAVKDAC
jgi:hypothetical protein